MPKTKLPGQVKLIQISDTLGITLMGELRVFIHESSFFEPGFRQILVPWKCYKENYFEHLYSFNQIIRNFKENPRLGKG